MIGCRYMVFWKIKLMGTFNRTWFYLIHFVPNFQLISNNPSIEINGEINPFVPNAPFLYPWKHQKTRKTKYLYTPLQDKSSMYQWSMFYVSIYMRPHSLTRNYDELTLSSVIYCMYQQIYKEWILTF